MSAKGLRAAVPVEQIVRLGAMGEPGMSELGAHHVEAAKCVAIHTRTFHAGRESRLYVVYVPRSSGEKPEPLASLVQYFVEHGAATRIPWQREVAYAVGLLIDFLAVLHARSPLESPSTSVHEVPTDALRAFAEYLVAGTLGDAAPEIRALNWTPCSLPRASRLLSLVTAFADWLSNRTGKRPSNPWRDATPSERMIHARRLERGSANALLRHAKSRQREEQDLGRTRTVRVSRQRIESRVGDVKAFDAAMFPALLTQGFGRKATHDADLARRFHLRDALIAILLHGGGLRVSEPFHLWVGDVSVETNDETGAQTAGVRVFHPQRGVAPTDGTVKWRDREHCLKERWRLQPRNLTHGRFHAGWKNLALTDSRQRCAKVEWFPTYWGDVFLSLYRAYLAARPSGSHPFLFVSESPACRGEPYTLASYEQAHAVAVRRIGLVPDKGRGTTAHGHRHAYGRALAAAKLDPLVIQRAMHHRSPESQLVYTGPDAAQLTAFMREASERVWGQLPDSLKEMV